MIHIPVSMRTISASDEFNKFQSILFMIAVYAKAANQMELFNQVKQAHDNNARQFNTQCKPKKGFWQEFKDNLLLNMDVESFVPAKCLDEKEMEFSVLYQYAKSLSLKDLQNTLNGAIADHNRKYGK